MNDPIQDLKDEEKEKLDWQSEPTAIEHQDVTNEDDDNSKWVFGLALIFIGLVFLVGNLTDFYLHNWWAVFILIPGLMTFANAWRTRKEDGHWSKQARGSLIGGLGITLVAVIFLFSLDWGTMWPLFLILGGIAALLGGIFD